MGEVFPELLLPLKLTDEDLEMIREKGYFYGAYVRVSPETCFALTLLEPALIKHMVNVAAEHGRPFVDEPNVLALREVSMDAVNRALAELVEQHAFKPVRRRRARAGRAETVSLSPLSIGNEGPKAFASAILETPSGWTYDLSFCTPENISEIVDGGAGRGQPYFFKAGLVILQEVSHSIALEVCRALYEKGTLHLMGPLDCGAVENLLEIEQELFAFGFSRPEMASHRARRKAATETLRSLAGGD